MTEGSDHCAHCVDLLSVQTHIAPQPSKKYAVYIPATVFQVDGPLQPERHFNLMTVQVKAESAQEALDKVTKAIANGVALVDAHLGIPVVEPKH